MTSKELQTYLATLKGVARKSTYKEVEIVGNEIKVRTEDQLYILKTEVEDKGVFEIPALDMLALDPTADLEPFRKQDEPNGIAEPKTKFLATTQVDKTLMELLDKATKFTSKDEFRKALMRVHIKDGTLFGTDGYRATLNRYTSTDFANFAPSTIASVKKCFKYGEWQMESGEFSDIDCISKFSNGVLTIWDRGVGKSQVPDMRKVISAGEAKKYNICDTLIKLPYREIKRIADKNTRKLEIWTDGELTLENLRLPLKAIITKEDYVYDEDDDMDIVLPRVDGDPTSLICTDFALLSCVKPDKDGMISLRMLAYGDGAKYLLHVA